MGVDMLQYNLNEPIDLSNSPKGMAVQFVFSGLGAPEAASDPRRPGGLT